MNRSIRFIMTAAFMAAATPALAGSLTPPGLPAAGSGMPTTADIYNRLDTGAAIAAPGVFKEPSAGPTVGTGKSLSDIQARLPVPDNASGAAVGEVLSGKTFWGLRTDGTWGVKTGSVTAGANVTGGNGSLTVTIPDALYSGGKTATAVDANLVTGNIKSGATIFGVSGNTNVVDTTEASAPATSANISNGKKAYVNGALVTGTMSGGGYPCTGTMNGTRWCGNGNGTVRDMTTGLLWLQNANCAATLAGIAKTGTLTWANADIWSSVLTSGSCGLSDGSAAGAWRQPTKDELYTLANGSEPVRSSTPRNFSGVPNGYYWSSSTVAYSTSYAGVVYMGSGYVYDGGKAYGYYVWPVRSGQ